MLIVEIKNGENIERALKTLKSKVIKTRQNQLLLEKKEFKKKSVRDREALLSAIHAERKRKYLN